MDVQRCIATTLFAELTTWPGRTTDRPKPPAKKKSVEIDTLKRRHIGDYQSTNNKGED